MSVVIWAWICKSSIEENKVTIVESEMTIAGNGGNYDYYRE